MIGVVLDRPCGELVRLALDERLLINVTAGSVIRLLPPLIMSDEQADDLVKRLGDVVLAWLDANATQVTD